MTMTRPRSRRLSGVALMATATALAVVGLASPADAHITVSADDAHLGATDSILTFRVPNEDATATTVKVTISFPKNNPLPSVKPAPKPGWVVTTTKTTFNPPIKTDDGEITDGVSQVVYTATGRASAIPVDGFDTFQVLVGPLPDKATSLAFPTQQTYSNGKTVSWDQPVTDPANEPDSPAPMLALSAADPAPAVSPAAAASATTAYATSSDLTTTRTLALAGLIVAALALIAGITAAALAARRAKA